MKFIYSSGVLSQIRGITRLKSVARDVGGISVLYGLYEIELDSRRLFAVSVSDISRFSLCTLEKITAAHDIFNLISENQVDTASFDGVIDDFLYSLNNIL